MFLDEVFQEVPKYMFSVFTCLLLLGTEIRWLQKVLLLLQHLFPLPYMLV